MLLLVAVPACQIGSSGGDGGGGTGAGEACIPPFSAPRSSPAWAVETDCSTCAVGCYAITPQISVCPDRVSPIATDCSPDVAKADNACACEGRTCAANQPCYKELVAWDGAEIHNVCGPAPQCLANTDCAAGEVCVPPFPSSSSGVILANPGGVCITPECQTDADCKAAPCGVCTLLVSDESVNSGRDVLDGIKCVYGKLSK